MATTVRNLHRDSTTRLGERVRQLRVSKGLTQGELAGDRFSKEYISQIERGKTRPTRGTIEWLAGQLGVDTEFLDNGVATDERNRIEARLARAEGLAEVLQHEDALRELDGVRASIIATGSLPLRVRLLAAEAWARMNAGDVRPAIDLLAEARILTEQPEFSEVERADILFRLGVCRYKLSSIATAVGLLDEALELTERSELPSDLLRSKILNWRSRCRRRQRDYEAAREDVERALELAEGLDDRRMTAHVYFQASLIAEREGHWVLARSYAERARAIYEEIEDRADVGRLLNNLGGLTYLLGNADEAVTYFKDAFKVLIDNGSDDEAGMAVSSLAQVQLGRGEVGVAEKQARHALTLLEGREDRIDEIGNAQLVLGRSLLEQGRLDEADVVFDEAEETFAKYESASHRAAVWIARGDLAARRGDDSSAARLYRQAAATLQDFRF
jgi:tetratricopeptide (TPR) repeat protein/DNA-binding XRE family transcriptional regulator